MSCRSSFGKQLRTNRLMRISQSLTVDLKSHASQKAPGLEGLPTRSPTNHNFRHNGAGIASDGTKGVENVKNYPGNTALVALWVTLSPREWRG